MNHPCATSFARAWGRPTGFATVKACPDDFLVIEQLPITPSGQGEHVWLHLRKRQLSTHALARQIARLAQIAPSDVSYSGLKDVMAVTEQWFSVHLANKLTPDWQQLENQQIKLIGAFRHDRKLRRGAHRKNRFSITLRDFAGDFSAFKQRWVQVISHGVPNYFGEQRFGREGQNVDRAFQMFDGAKIKDRYRRGLLLSAARSWLFNLCLSERIKEKNWLSLHPGEPAILNGTGSFFHAEGNSDEIERLATGDIHPSCPLWGEFDDAQVATYRQLHDEEARICQNQVTLVNGLRKNKLKYSRRATRCIPTQAQLEQTGGVLRLQFELSKGQFATSVLRELIHSQRTSH